LNLRQRIGLLAAFVGETDARLRTQELSNDGETHRHLAPAVDIRAVKSGKCRTVRR